MQTMTNKTPNILFVTDNLKNAELLHKATRKAIDSSKITLKSTKVRHKSEAPGIAEFDLAILDLSEQQSNGVKILKKIRKVFPVTPLLVLTDENDGELGPQCLALGAESYLPLSQCEGILGTVVHAFIQRDLPRKDLLECLKGAANLTVGSNDGILIISVGNTIKFLNKPAENLFENQINVGDYFNFPLEGDKLREIDIHCRDGSSFSAEMRKAQASWAGEKAIVIVLRAVTQIQAPKNETDQFKLSLLSAIDERSSHIAILDDSGKILFVNRAWREFAQANGESDNSAYIGKNYLKVCDFATGTDSENAKSFSAGVRAVISGIKASFEQEYQCNSETEQSWFIGRVTPFPHQGVHFTAVFHESITGRRKTEFEILRNSDTQRVLNKLMRASLEKKSITETLEIALDLVLSITWLCLKGCGAIFLVEKDSEMLEMKIHRNLCPELVNACARVPFGRCLCGSSAKFQKIAYSRGADEFHDSTYAGISPHGHYCVPILSGNKILGVVNLFISEGHVRSAFEENFLSTFADSLAMIIERRKAENERERLLAAILQAGESVVIADKNGDIQFVNPAFERISGYQAAEVLGKNPRFLRSGKQDSVFYENLWGIITSGKSWNGRIINKRKDGSIFVEDASISPVKDDSGNIVNYVAVKQDITHNLEIDEQIRQTQRMESIGRLTSGIAHDFNNVLGVILGNGEILLDKFGDLDPLREHAQEITEAANRAIGLTRQLLDFSRNQVKVRSITNLNDLIRDISKLLSKLIGENIEFVTKLEKKIGLVEVDPGKMEQVIMNLVVNARDAMPDGGKLTIETSQGFLENEKVSSQKLAGNVEGAKRPTAGDEGCEVRAQNLAPLLHPEGGRVPPFIEKLSGMHVLVTVSDTGTGMDDETRKRIFEPFFTTKERGKGTGLGLSTVFEIVKQSMGSILVESNPGMGTTFKVYLPVTLAEESKLAEPTQHLEMDGNGESILIIEEDDLLRNLYARALRKLSYQVVTARNASAALQILEEGKYRPDILLIDTVLPGMSGPRLVNSLKETFPNLKILYMSGDIDNPILQNEITLNRVPFIQKPFQISELAKKIREILTEK